MNRRIVGTALAVPLLAATLGLGGCDTRYCRIEGARTSPSCDVGDLHGVVVNRTERASDDSHQPSLLIDPNGQRRGGNVRVWLKEQFWARYHVGSSYP